MLVIACVTVSLLLAVALVVCRTRLHRVRARPGDPVDYAAIPGTQMFDAELVPIPPSAKQAIVEDDPPPDPADN